MEKYISGVDSQLPVRSRLKTSSNQGISEGRSILVLSSTRYLKVVVYSGENRFVPFSSICSVMKVSRYKYLDCYLVANNILKTTMEYMCSLTNYSSNWRWLVVDIYRASKRRGKYPPLATDIEVNSC